VLELDRGSTLVVKGVLDIGVEALLIRIGILHDLVISGLGELGLLAAG